MNYILARLREPSTYAGIAAVLAAFNVHVDPGLWGTIVQIGIGAAGLVAAVTPDRSATQAASFSSLQDTVDRLTRRN